MTDIKPPSFWKFWKEHPEFTPDKLEKDIREVQKLYRRGGYYQAKIAPKVSRRKHEVIITLIIDEGPPVIIEKISFTIQRAETAKWERQLRELIPLQEAKILKTKNYEKSKTKILEHLANTGYPGARLLSKAIVYEKENQADILFTLEPGPNIRFGKINLSGNKKVTQDIILREVAFSEGETYSLAKILQTQSQIYKLDLFHSVFLEQKDLYTEKGPVDIEIQVNERKPRTIETGIGYGTEDELRFRLAGIYRNFLGSAQELRLSFKISSLTEKESLTFTQPYFPDSSSTFRSSLSRGKDKFVSFDTITLSIENRVNKKFGPVFSGFLAHKFESSKLREVSKITQEELDFTQEEEYFLSYIQTGLKLDTSDSPVNPANGYLISVFLEPSLKVIGSEISYLKNTFEYRHYTRIINGPVLAGRLLLGTIQPIGLNQKEIPLFKRFYSGGTYSMRGYKYQQLGPLDKSGDPIGGNSILEGSTEVRFPFKGNLWGVVFLDFGNVFLDSWEFKLEELRYSMGTGIRYHTVVGPLRLDFGYILNPQKSTDKRYRIHLSLGQAF